MQNAIKIILVALIPYFSGCAVATMTVAGTGASLGVSYTITNIAEKTFNFPLTDVDEATFQALKKLNFNMVKYEDLGEERKIRVAAKDRDIRIKLERITTATTQMRVDARTWPFFKDRATAVEVIHQVLKILEPDAFALVQND
jgi:hypothetical protein